MGTLTEQIKQILQQDKSILEIIDDLIEADPESKSFLYRMKYELTQAKEKYEKMNDREKANYNFNQYVKDCKDFGIEYNENEVKKTYGVKK